MDSLHSCLRMHVGHFSAIFYIGGVVGPAIAFIAGGYVLVVFTDFYSVDAEKEWVKLPSSSKYQ